ncbi:MAG: DJ-1/PfpI family protein [Clostridia bacterium]|nr:DJ-1/PfpI family protein [Clostridia bacterium]
MIYMLLADGFEEIEALEPLDILRRAEIEVKTAGLSEIVEGAHGIKVIPDISIDAVNTNDMELLFLPGGSGHTNLDNSKDVHSLIDTALSNDKYIASICAAPSILGKRGILNGKKATCFPGFEKFLEGALVTGEKIVVDGKLITAKGAGAAADLGFKIVEILKDKKTADKLKEVMQY